MGQISKTFIEEFHGLSGTSIKERQQNLFQLLFAQYPVLSENQEELDYVCTNLKPTTYLEDIFRIDFLIYFRRFEELFQEFTNGNDIAVSKLIKRDWFLQTAFKDIGAEDFVNSELPRFGYNVRLKILNKLSFNEQKCDEIFDAVHDRYGILLATVLLYKCTTSKIQETLENQVVKLTPAQLTLICKKDSKLISIYFEERTKHEGGSTFINFNPVLAYIASKDPEVFSHLFSQYNFEINKLGYQTTKKFIASQGCNILPKLQDYFKILNTRCLVRKLGNELKDLFFVFNKGTSQYYWKDLLPHYPKKRQFDIYRSVHDQVNYLKFGQNANTIDEEILKIIPDPEEREKFARIKMHETKNATYLFKYFTPEHCMQECMAEVNKHPSSSKCCGYIRTAVDCCVLNRDMMNFLKLCEIVAVRFINENRKIRADFIYALADDMIFFDTLTEDHWRYIFDIIAAININEEYNWAQVLVCQQYMKQLIDNDKPITNFIINYSKNVKCLVWVEMFVEGEWIWKNPVLIRKVICGLIETGLPNPPEDDELAAANFDCMLATACQRYNKKYSKNPINILNNSRILASVKQVLEKRTVSFIYGSCAPGIEFMLCQKNLSDELAEMKKRYFSSMEDFDFESAGFWFLRHEPLTFQENFDQFLVNHVEVWKEKSPKELWRWIKKYTHLDLDQKTVDFCKLKLKEDKYKHKSKLIRVLSILSEPNLHLEFIKSYIPTSFKVDLSNEDEKNLYNIQSAFIQYLHLVKAPAAIIPTTLQFCEADYLKHALALLYSSICRLPDEETKPIIEKLQEGESVAVKRHAMNLSCLVYDRTTVYNCLNNATVPLLVPTLKYFAKNPSEALWQLLEERISETESTNLQIFNKIMNITVPFDYKSKYLEVLWNVISKHNNDTLKENLIKKIDKSAIEKLNPELAYKIIQDSIFKIEQTDDFVASLLINISDDKKIDFFSKVLTTFKENEWERPETERISRRKLDSFIKTLLKTYIDFKESNQKFVDGFSACFKSVFLPHEAIEESVIISLMVLKDKTKENLKLLFELKDHYGQMYGMLGKILFTETLQCHVVPLLYKTEEERIQLCYDLLKLKPCCDDGLLIIKLLPKIEPKIEKHFKILEQLKQVDNESVKMLFSLYFKPNPKHKKGKDFCGICCEC